MEEKMFSHRYPKFHLDNWYRNGMGPTCRSADSPTYGFLHVRSQASFWGR
jgi:hypothetical protein